MYEYFTIERAIAHYAIYGVVTVCDADTQQVYGEWAEE